MISSEVHAAPRSLADQMSDISQRFDHDVNDAANHHTHPHHQLINETSSHKVYQ